MTDDEVCMRQHQTSQSSIPRGASGKRVDDIEGFTLIELLVVLLLTATMATMVVGVMSQLRPIKAIEDSARLQRIADRIADVMAEDIRSALPLPLLSSQAEGRTMIGTKNRIEFVAVVRTGFRTKGLREVTYLLADTNQGKTRLVRRTKPRRFNGAAEVRQTPGEDMSVPVEGLELGYRFRHDYGSVYRQQETREQNRPAIAATVTVLVSRRNRNAFALRYIPLH